MKLASKSVLATLVVLIIAAALCGGLAYHVSFHSIPQETTKEDPRSVVVEYGTNGVQSFGELFRDIKSMTIQFNFTNAGLDGGANGGSLYTSSETISYVAELGVTEEGTVAYKVNLTDTYFTIGGSDNNSLTESAIVWADTASSNILSVSMDGQQWTGADAQKESGVLSFITATNWLSLLNSSTVVPISVNQTANIGSTLLYKTTFESVSTIGPYNDMNVIIGFIPQDGLQLVLSNDYTVSGGIGSFRVVSLDLNQ